MKSLTLLNESEQIVTSSATVTPTGDWREQSLEVTAQAAAMTVAAPSGTARNGNTILFRFKDNATARAITWDAIYRWFVVKPTTTVISKTMYLRARYNSADTKWDVIAYLPEP